MKKPSVRRSVWLAIHAKKLRRRRVRKQKLTPRLGLVAQGVLPEMSTSVRALFKRTVKSRRPCVSLVMPGNLRFDENRHALMDVVTAIRACPRILLPVWFDFSELARIDDIGALVLAAEIDRATRIRYSGHLPSTYKDSRWRPEVERILCELGFFKLLRVKNPPERLPANANEVRHIEYLTGVRSAGQAITTLKERYADLMGCQIDIDPAMPNEARPLYDAVIEAMTNVSNHAYPATVTTHPDIEGRWWIAGSYDPVNQKFTIVFYDTGVGIPATLVANHRAEKIAEVMKRIVRGREGDAERIKTAMFMGKSRTGYRYRGKGLKRIRKLAQARTPARFRVLSAGGEYDKSYPAPGNPPIPETLRNDAARLPGTLIFWEVSLRSLPK